MELRELNRAFEQFSPTLAQREALGRRILEQAPGLGSKRNRIPVVLAAAVGILAASGAAAVTTGFGQHILDYFGVPQREESLFAQEWRPVELAHTFLNGWSVEVRQMYTDLYSAGLLVDVSAPEGVVLDGERYSLRYFWDEADYRSTRMGGGRADFIPDENKTDGRVSFLVTARSINLEPGSFLGLETEFYPYQLIEYSDGQGAEETFDFVGGSWTVDLDITLSPQASGFVAPIKRSFTVGEEEVILEHIYLSPLTVFYTIRSPQGGSFPEQMWGAENVLISLRSGETICMGEPIAGTAWGGPEAESSEAPRRYIFSRIGYRPERVFDPEEAVSLTILGQTFPLENLTPVGVEEEGQET